jgi:FkbH-like protein
MPDSVAETSVDQAISVDALAFLNGADFFQLSASEVAALDRRIRRLELAPDLRVAYQGNHTIEPLPSFVGVRCACSGIIAASWTGEFNQHRQEVLDPDSLLVEFDPQLIFLSLSLRELAPGVHDAFDTLSTPDKQAELARIVGHIRDWAGAAKAVTDASLVIANFPTPSFPATGIADFKAEFGEVEFHTRLNLALIDAFRADLRAHVLDLDRVASRFGKLQSFSAPMQYLARLPWDARLLPHLADEMHRYVHAVLGRSRKCLALDLDNTLWGGVLGEDGPEGVEIGSGTPRAEAFHDFQHAILALKRRGVILAINSKNNPEDVHELFANRSMPLRQGDFATSVINWQNKHENLKLIADQLNIGLDSLVFMDDSPVECEIVRQMLPAVQVVELPRDPAEYAGAVRRLDAFETLLATAEDKVKTRQYLDKRRRAELQQATGSLDDYLHSLATELRIRRATTADAARLQQLFVKTNQFNLTTKRYSAADVEGFLHDPRFDFRAVEVRDRFGDLGTVGVVLVDRAAAVPVVDSLVLSCRALGREVESAIMNRIKLDYLQRGRHPALLGIFIPTKKNLPAREFYPRQGFTLVETRGSGEHIYRLTRSRCFLLDCGHIAVVDEAP